MKHDIYCENQEVEYYTSGCEPFCEYYKEAVQECRDSGEHFKHTTPENGYDVCFNCGAKE